MRPNGPSVSLDQFRSFYDDYQNGGDSTRKLSRLDHLVTMELGAYVALTSTNPDLEPVNFEDPEFAQLGTIIKRHPHFISIKRGPFVYTVFYDHIIFIENPTEERIQEIRDTPDEDEFSRASHSRAISWCADYVLTAYGDIHLRSGHQEFFDKVEAGQAKDALTYAIRVLERSIRG